MMKGFYGTIYGQSYLVFKDECEYMSAKGGSEFAPVKDDDFNNYENVEIFSTTRKAEEVMFSEDCDVPPAGYFCLPATPQLHAGQASVTKNASSSPLIFQE